MAKKKEPGHIPPFTVSAEAINMIAEISGQIERYAIRLELEDGLRLRKANRIKTIHSSLAIEGNTLSEDEVRDIIEGKTVVAPIKQIQEVKNAIATYELYPTLDAFRENDLLKAHGVMMQALIDQPGRYRSGGVGVFGEKGLVHLAPPAERVPILMSDLFNWLKNSKDHLLIRSCVFHYEFEFIHPFLDGNGRTGRLWQSLILGKLHPLFEHLPVENMVYANQQAYYNAIGESSRQGQSGPFIDFMLAEIFKTLKAHQGEPLPNKVQGKVPSKIPNKVPNKLRDLYPEMSDATWVVYMGIKANPHATAAELGLALGIGSRMVRKHIAVLREAKLIERIGGYKTGYWKIIKK